MKITLQVLALMLGSTFAVSAAHAGAFDGCTNLSGRYQMGGMVETITQTDCNTVTIKFHETQDEITVIHVDGSVQKDNSGQYSKSQWVNGALVQTTMVGNGDGSFSPIPGNLQGKMTLLPNGDLQLVNSINGQDGIPAELPRLK